MGLLFAEPLAMYFCWNISLGNNPDIQNNEMSGKFMHSF